MTKIFPDLQTKAAAYAAYKELERMLEIDGTLPPGCNFQVGNNTVEIVLPPQVTVTRDKGINGEIEKTATQNLYGWAILHECFNIARLFKQHKRLEQVLLKIVRRAIKRAISTKEAFTQLHPQQAQAIDSLKKSLKLPKRKEPTPRMVNRQTAAMATVSVKRRLAA
jgi:type II secretory pathway component PulJ